MEKENARRYRRAWALLRREGLMVNVKRVHRPWRKEGWLSLEGGRESAFGSDGRGSRSPRASSPPKYLRSDNGPEFIAKALRGRLEVSGIQTAYSDLGKPWQNGTNESFNGRFRDECLSAEWFANRREAVVRIEA
ncbi:hypothetical protein BHS07_08665 [Myxococcus xanthus]|nr:hypothetical protein BHS07_08665 [Myxococcus xanthus]QDE95950.1 hypothetical protein BHS05_08795 [Myxococcus xanthus]QDF03290.1 hypothetical protein BHS04_08705 [Myxococcus xanthus]